MDRATLTVGGTKIENLLCYRFEADIYTADHAFSIELSQPATRIGAGAQCKIRINNELALTGIVDRVVKGSDKQGARLTLEGRDLMGLLVDSCCTQFMTLKGVTLKSLAETLLAKTPFINRSKIVYQQGLVASKRNGGAPGAPRLSAIDEPQAYAQIEPGRTIFEVLSNYARSRGFMFFSLPDGTFVFGRPKAAGAAAFHLTRKKAGSRNNVIMGQRTEDYSRRFSQVTVMGQRQGTDSISAAGINTAGTVTDTAFPFYKPLVRIDNNDLLSPALHARAIMEKAKHEGESITYTTAGLTQNGRAWTVNELCRVKDDDLGIEGTYLIFARAFEMSRDGVFTTVRLGPPGLVA